MGVVAYIQCSEASRETYDQRVLHHSYLIEKVCTISNAVFGKYRPVPLHIALAVVAYDSAALIGMDSAGLVHLSAFNRHTVCTSKGEAVVDAVLAVAEYLVRVTMD